MTLLGHTVRRHFEPLVLSLQVLIDLGVVLCACWLGYELSYHSGGTARPPTVSEYFRLWALTMAVCLTAFHVFGMYSPVKSLLNIEEYKALTKSCLVAFLAVFTLVVLLRSTPQEAEGRFFSWLVPLHRLIDLEVDPTAFSRLAMVLTFVFVFLLMGINRFLTFKFIQSMHVRGIGNRNVLILGTGDTARRLQRKFHLVPTLGLHLSGFLTVEEAEVGQKIGEYPILGRLEDLERLIGAHKIHEVFVALPESSEDSLMEVVQLLEHHGVTFRVVPRFYHLLAQSVRIETLDSIPLISRVERSQGLFTRAVKRLFDILLSSLILLVAIPFFLVAAILIRRESEGPIFFRQLRIGRDGRAFPMFKFRTMYHHMSADAHTPSSAADPRITKIGRFLRRTSLDELPQFLNVLRGEMSIVGPRPEMPFIVESYRSLDRERLRAKPGITGLWQISTARGEAITEYLDYDLYYLENQSFLLDVLIIGLTCVAVVKGSGAH